MEGIGRLCCQEAMWICFQSQSSGLTSTGLTGNLFFHKYLSLKMLFLCQKLHPCRISHSLARSLKGSHKARSFFRGKGTSDIQSETIWKSLSSPSVRPDVFCILMTYLILIGLELWVRYLQLFFFWQSSCKWVYQTRLQTWCCRGRVHEDWARNKLEGSKSLQQRAWER